MTHALVAPELSGDILSSQVREAFQGFTSAAGRLEEAYAALRKQVAALDIELEESNARLTRSLQENARVRNYLSNILKSIEKGIVVVDPGGQITLWSGGAEKLTGFTASEALGGRVDRLLGGDAAALLLALHGEGHEGTREGRIARNDGYVLEAELSASSIRDEEGRIRDALLVFDDISRRKWAEERRRRSTAQAGLEEMAVTIAHGIRNPLASIELLATILAEEVRGDVRKSRLAHDIQSGVASVNTILTNLLAFSRPLRVHLKLLDLHVVIEDALSTALYALKERQIDLIRLYHPGPLEIDGDRELLKQVFLNLILNSVQAMPSGGKLRIITRVLISECQVPHLGPTSGAAPFEAQVHERGAPPVSELIEVVVSDSGCGIRESDLDKIFLPFFTTKAKGAGLGLAVVERILERHGARASLESQTGKGAAFTLQFTRGRETAARAPDEDLA